MQSFKSLRAKRRGVHHLRDQSAFVADRYRTKSNVYIDIESGLGMQSQTLVINRPNSKRSWYYVPYDNKQIPLIYNALTVPDVG